MQLRSNTVFVLVDHQPAELVDFQFYHTAYQDQAFVGYTFNQFFF